MFGLVVVVIICLILAYTITKQQYKNAKPWIPKQTMKYILEAALVVIFVKHLIRYLLVAAFFHILTVLVTYGIKHF